MTLDCTISSGCYGGGRYEGGNGEPGIPLMAFCPVLLDDRVRAIGATVKNTLLLPGSEELEVFTCGDQAEG